MTDIAFLASANASFVHGAVTAPDRGPPSEPTKCDGVVMAGLLKVLAFAQGHGLQGAEIACYAGPTKAEGLMMND